MPQEELSHLTMNLAKVICRLVRAVIEEACQALSGDSPLCSRTWNGWEPEEHASSPSQTMPLLPDSSSEAGIVDGPRALTRLRCLLQSELDSQAPQCVVPAVVSFSHMSPCTSQAPPCLPRVFPPEYLA